MGYVNPKKEEKGKGNQRREGKQENKEEEKEKKTSSRPVL